MATELAPNTVSKLFYFDSRIKSFYEKYGYTSVPFDGARVQKMIEDARKDIAGLFRKIWGSSMGYHLLGRFYEFQGNVYEFYMSLDRNSHQLFSKTDW